MSKIYKLVYIHDLLLVPADRRSACLREIEQVLLLDELIFDDNATAVHRDYEWTDDEDRSATVTLNGKPFVTMKVSKQERE